MESWLCVGTLHASLRTSEAPVPQAAGSRERPSTFEYPSTFECRSTFECNLLSGTLCDRRAPPPPPRYARCRHHPREAQIPTLGSFPRYVSERPSVSPRIHREVMQASGPGDADRAQQDTRQLPEVGPWEGRCKATWKREFKPPWREAGPPNHHDDKEDSDQ